MSIEISNSTKDIVVGYYNDKGTPNVETITVPATASAAQGDYVVLTNAYGSTIACWLDIDANGTAPTGAIYVAADYKLKISIVTGGTSAQNGTVFAQAVDAHAWSAIVSIIDNANGTVKVSQLKGAAVNAAVPKTANDGAAGSIVAATDTIGEATSLKLEEYHSKGGLYVSQHKPSNCIILGNSPYSTKKGTESILINFSDVVSPVTTDLAALTAQVIAWKNA